MPRTGENIYKRKDGRWEGRYLYSHDVFRKAKYRSVYAKSYAKVKKKLRELPTKILQQKPVLVEKTFADLTIDWLFSAHAKVKESTFSRYQRTADKHIIPHFGYYTTTQITRQLIEDYVNKLMDSGRLQSL
jgi:hypothetical protein